MLAKDWRSLFSLKFFEDESKPFLEAVDEHLNAVVASVPPSMREDARSISESARKRAQKYIAVALTSAREFADKEQKHIPGALTKCMKSQLKGMYEEVMKVSGSGSISKQKVRR